MSGGPSTDPILEGKGIQFEVISPDMSVMGSSNTGRVTIPSDLTPSMFNISSTNILAVRGDTIKTRNSWGTWLLDPCSCLRGGEAVDTSSSSLQLLQSYNKCFYDLTR